VAALGTAAAALVAAPSGALEKAAPASGGPGSGRADVDHDGRVDCWKATYHGGSGFGGTHLDVRPGCGHAIVAVDTFGSFGELLEAAPVTPAAAAPTPLAVGMAGLLYGDAAIRTLDDEPAGATRDAVAPLDGSFRWLLDAFQGAPRPAAAPFADVRRVRPSWGSGPPILPPTQAVLLRDPRYARTARALDAGDPPADLGYAPRPPGSPFAILGYRAHNHGALREAGRCGRWRVDATAHAVALFDEAANTHAWVWLVSGATKLRWPSVRAVRCLGELLVIERFIAGPVDLVVVDPASGSFGRIATADADTWRLDADTLVFHGTRYPAAALSAALRPPPDWATRSDLDGDALPDPIEVTFSGGAHCCYRLAVTASRTKVRYPLRYELEGGYVGGLDLSLPRNFDVADFDRDGVLDLLMDDVVVTFTSGAPVARPLGRL
jgi:hypothetical protein